jgi:hypothetical protein
MPFQKGESGNPAGRPKGVADRRHLVRDLLLPDAHGLVSKAVELALQGDPVMLKACLDKLIPNARPNTEVQFSSEASVASSGRSVISLVSSGEASLEEGRAALSLLAIQAKLEEQDTLTARITALEEAHGVN